MQLDIVTREEFNQLLKRVGELENKRRDKPETLTNRQLKDMFGWSESKLYRLRSRGILKSQQVNGTHYYNYDEVMSTFAGNKQSVTN